MEAAAQELHVKRRETRLLLPSMNRRSTYVLSIFTLVCWCSVTSFSTLAAPASSEELRATNPEPSNAMVNPSLPLVTGESVSQSKTVELLLQLQDQAQEMKPSGSGSKRLSEAPGRTSPANAAVEAEPNPLLSLKESLLGPSAAQPAGSDSRQAVSLERAAEAYPSPGGPNADTRSRRGGEPRDSLLSHPVIRFIRENRALVVGGSLAVLAGLWLTANFSMRRSR